MAARIKLEKTGSGTVPTPGPSKKSFYVRDSDGHFVSKDENGVIFDYESNSLNVFAWQKQVINTTTTVPPSIPTDGDRYIVAVGASGDWAGQDNNIAEWQETSWVFYTPEEGWACYVLDEDRFIFFNDVEDWVGFSSGVLHNSLSGIQGGTTNEYYHLTLEELEKSQNWEVINTSTDINPAESNKIYQIDAAGDGS